MHVPKMRQKYLEFTAMCLNGDRKFKNICTRVEMYKKDPHSLRNKPDHLLCDDELRHDYPKRSLRVDHLRTE